MKTTTTRLSRERAREVLGRVEGELAGVQGHPARERAAKLLNTLVPTYSWVGIYLVQGNDLVLDSWSGPAPTQHTLIPIGTGVCGFAAKAGRTEIVSDVGRDSRYIECFPSTRAEIVVPVFHQQKVVAEIDVDGDQLDAFSSLDREFLEAVARLLGPLCF